ncbi:MAG: gamma-glutamyltransferase, partial [Gemmatimonadales bacterium]
MSRYRLLLAVVSLAAACGGASPAPTPAPRRVFPEGWTYPEHARRLVAPQAVVAAGSSIASEVGRDILRQGGNAVDAA